MVLELVNCAGALHQALRRTVQPEHGKIMDETQQQSMNARTDAARNATPHVMLVGVVVLALVLVLGLLLFATMLLLGAGAMTGSNRMGGMMSGQSGSLRWPRVVTVVSWLLVVVGVILLLIWGIRRLRERGIGVGAETPLAILQRRYARGEIGPEEYERIRADVLRDGGDQ